MNPDRIVAWMFLYAWGFLWVFFIQFAVVVVEGNA